MPELKNTSLKLLNWYKSIGIDICVQNIPRERLKVIRTDNKKNIISNKSNNLKNLQKQIREFNGYELKKNASRLVFGDGNPNSKIMLIGEAPGYEEDKSGLPFVGAAGKKLDQMINAIGLDRKKNVYITNILPWRPPNNRTPTENETLTFLPFVCALQVLPFYNFSALVGAAFYHPYRFRALVVFNASTIYAPSV